MAQFTMIIGFQTFSVDVLKISPAQIGILYAGFGISGIIMQLSVPLLTKWLSSKSMILLLSSVLCMAAMFLTGLNAIIADHINHNEQGKILGINQSYASIGQTIGPVTAGFAGLISVHAIFFLSSLYILIALLLSFRLTLKA
jgi:MFS family permease